MKNPILLIGGLTLAAGLGYYVNAASAESNLTPSRYATETSAKTIVAAPESDAAFVTEGGVSFNCLFENPYLIEDAGSEYVHLLVTAIGGAADASLERTPLNLSVVIDRSGSMESQDKLEYAKTACQLVLDNLSAQDNISIVTYDDNVDLVKKSGALDQKEMLKKKVSTIRSGGSTNLSGGMLEGYAQTFSTFAQHNINRVLLLSDGLANKGITDPMQLKKIVEQKFAEQGIAVSTFGVGADYNEDLMTDLAEYGRGNYYFIKSADEMPEIFKKELDGLLSVVAQNAKLTIEFPQELFTVDKVYGHASEVNGNTLSINYNDIFADEEKTVLIRFKKKSGISTDPSFKASISFDDVQEGYKRLAITQDLALQRTNDASLYAESMNVEVKRNIMLFESIERFDEAAREADAGRYDKAQEIIEQNKGTLDLFFESTTPDEALLDQYRLNDSYGDELEEVELKSSEEIRSMQKENKSSNYDQRKKK